MRVFEPDDIYYIVNGIKKLFLNKGEDNGLHHYEVQIKGSGNKDGTYNVYITDKDHKDKMKTAVDRVAFVAEVIGVVEFTVKIIKYVGRKLPRV